MDDASAEHYFRDALRLNPECAAAWLGLVMANERYPERAVFFLKHGRQAKDTNDAEKAWFSAYEHFFDHSNGADLVQRLSGLAKKFKEMGEEGDERKRSCAKAFSLRYEILAAHFAGIPVADMQVKDEWLNAVTKKPECQVLSVYGVLLWRNLDVSKALVYGQLLLENEVSIYAKRLLVDTYVLGGRLDHAERLLREISFPPADFQDENSQLRQHVQFRFDALRTLAWVCFHQRKFDDSSGITYLALAEQRKPGFTALADVNDELDDSYLQAWRLFVQVHLAMGRWDEVAKYSQLRIEQEPGLLAGAYRQYWAAAAAILMKDRENFVHYRSQLVKKQNTIRNTPYLTAYETEIGRCLKGLDAFEQLYQGRITPYLHQIIDVPVNVMSVLLARAGAADNGIKKLEEALTLTPASGPWNLALTEISRHPISVSLDVLSDTPQPAGQSVLTAQLRQGRNPGIKLPDKSGVIRDYSTLSGQPTLLIFFLGQGCPHCIEQLQVFRSHIASFEQSGARIITVGTDSVQQLASTLGNSSQLNPDLPYLILADPGLAAFKAWGCFDEFQNKSLHGTFLLDESGAVIWRDISHDPYTQPVFLLSEFKRLLSTSLKASSTN